MAEAATHPWEGKIARSLPVVEGVRERDRAEGIINSGVGKSSSRSRERSELINEHMLRELRVELKAFPLTGGVVRTVCGSTGGVSEGIRAELQNDGENVGLS